MVRVILFQEQIFFLFRERIRRKKLIFVEGISFYFFISNIFLLFGPRIISQSLYGIFTIGVTSAPKTKETLWETTKQGTEKFSSSFFFYTILPYTTTTSATTVLLYNCKWKYLK